MKCAALALIISAGLSQAQMPGARTDDRIRAYESLLRKSPANEAIENELLTAYLQKVRETADYRYLDLASRLVDGMLQRDGGNFEALRFENEIDLQRHNFRAVADRARDMIRYNPSDPGIWGNLGDALMELGDYSRAGEAYLKMFALRPNLASYNRLGYFRFVTGNADAAIALMQAAIEAGSSTPENVAWCWSELGDIYFKTGKLESAQRAYENARKLFPSLHRASAGLGRTQAAQGDLAAAIHSYQRAQSIVPMVEYAGALEDLFAITGTRKEEEKQRDLVDAIARLGAATNEKTNRNLALVLADHNRNPGLALRLLRTEIQDRPDVYTWDALSWALLRNGRIEEAQDASRHALELQTPEPSFYYHARAIAMAAGDRDAARRFGERMASLNPRFDPVKPPEETSMARGGR